MLSRHHRELLAVELHRAFILQSEHKRFLRAAAIIKRARDAASLHGRVLRHPAQVEPRLWVKLLETVGSRTELRRPHLIARVDHDVLAWWYHCQSSGCDREGREAMIARLDRRR